MSSAYSRFSGGSRSFASSSLILRRFFELLVGHASLNFGVGLIGDLLIELVDPPGEGQILVVDGRGVRVVSHVGWLLESSRPVRSDSD